MDVIDPRTSSVLEAITQMADAVTSGDIFGDLDAFLTDGEDGGSGKDGISSSESESDSEPDVEGDEATIKRELDPEVLDESLPNPTSSALHQDSLKEQHQSEEKRDNEESCKIGGDLFKDRMVTKSPPLISSEQLDSDVPSTDGLHPRSVSAVAQHFTRCTHPEHKGPTDVPYDPSSGVLVGQDAQAWVNTAVISDKAAGTNNQQLSALNEPSIDNEDNIDIPYGETTQSPASNDIKKPCDLLREPSDIMNYRTCPAYSSVYNAFQKYQAKVKSLSKKLHRALNKIAELQFLLQKPDCGSSVIVKTEILEGGSIYVNASTQTIGKGKGGKSKLLISSSDEDGDISQSVKSPLKVKIVPKKRRVKRTPRKKIILEDDEDEDPEYFPTPRAGSYRRRTGNMIDDDNEFLFDKPSKDTSLTSEANRKEFSCFTCQMVFDRPKDLKDHLKTHSTTDHDQLHPCPICDKSYLTKKGLRNHERLSHGVKNASDVDPVLKPHTCSVCSKSYTTKKGLRKHYNSAHQDNVATKPFPCDECSRSFKQQDHLDSHKRWHRGEKPYECVTCKAVFSRIAEMKMHMAKQHGDRPYKCNSCDSSFTELKHLRRHKLTHNPEKAFICDVCGKAFSRLTRLNAHQRTHSGVRPYVCEVCNRAFTDIKYLLHHRRTHTGEKPFCCDICGKMFAVSITLMQHRRTHTGERPYQCDQCDMSFTTSSNLNRHKRRHSGVKPFNCPVCNKAFSRSCDVTRHQITHTGVKPFKCEYCNISFGRRSHLVRHQKKHDSTDGAGKQHLMPHPPEASNPTPQPVPEEQAAMANPPSLPHNMSSIPANVPISQITQISQMIAQQAAQAQQAIPPMQNIESVIPTLALPSLIPEHKYPHMSDHNRTVYYQ